MFYEIFRFELRQQLKAPLFWIVALAFAGLAFAFASTDVVVLGDAVGNVLRNAPMVIANALTLLGVLSLFLIVVFIAGAALRDFDLDTADLVFSTPVTRLSYLGGRFLAGYLISVAVLLCCALGLLLGGLMPWVDQARIGPIAWSAYAWTFAVMLLPNLLFMAGLLFLLASTTRSLLMTYIGVIAYLVLRGIATQLTQDVNNHSLAGMIDPFGGRTLGLVTRYWSPEQMNHQLPTLQGLLLYNRLLWSGVGAALLGLSFLLFRTQRQGLPRRWRKPRAEPPRLQARGAATAVALPTATLRDDLACHLRQLLRLWRFDLGGVLRGAPFLIILILGLAKLLGTLALSGEIYGTPTWPVTHVVLTFLRDSFNFLLYIVVMFYAGELIWRERTQRSAEVGDALPLPDWVPLAAKLLALLAVIVLFELAGMAVCVGWQLAHGYTRLEPGLYLSMGALDVAPLLLLAVLAVFLQVLANHKFLGYLLTIVWLLVTMLGFGLLHWDDHLYAYASTPSVPYSDMNGYGHFLAPALWFDAYWGWLAVALIVLAGVFWVRGVPDSWRARQREARRRLRGRTGAVLTVTLAGFALTGGWIFYNTHVLNTYRSSADTKRMRAQYEQRYARYAGLPQPRITAVDAHVDIYPYAPRHLAIRLHYVLTNKHAAPIGTLYVNYDNDFATSLHFAAHDTLLDDRRLGFAIYRLKTPLAPGASMDFDATLDYAPKGFRNEPGDDTALVSNGTFFNSSVMPHFGYQPGEQLTDRDDRRKYGLSGAVPRMPRLGDPKARGNTYIANDADWIAFQATVSTALDQTAVAPGYLDRSWVAGGRRYFHYTMRQDGHDVPMLPFYAFLSARYAVRRATGPGGVAIEVYYNPAHAWNVDRMIEAVQDSLAWYDTHYTPYQFHQLRILEFPDYAAFAQSFANTVPFSESIGFIADLRDPRRIDYVYYVTAHEVAHQWWAHRVIGADMQGSTMLSESLAQYSALMVMKHKYGADQMRRFLKYELDKYLAGRTDETVAEEPLAKVENQPYIHYRKGSLIFYALQDYLGEGLVDGVLKQFLIDKGFQQPPYTDSQEFMDALTKAAGPRWRGMLDDFFWKITLYDNRISNATARKLPDGRYQVTMKLHTGKFYVDGIGKETAAAPGIPIQVGVFAAPTVAGQDGKPLYLERRVLPDGDSTLSVIVTGKPAEAGIDPYNELIDRHPADNRHAVTLQ